LDERRWRGSNRLSVRVGRSACVACPRWWWRRCCSGSRQRCRRDAVKTKQADLRALCNELRRAQVATIGVARHGH
jgi:hypothetical protein